MALNHIHHVHQIRVGADGKVSRHPVGRFLTAGGHLNILEDHHGHLGKHFTQGLMTVDHLHKIHQLHNSQYLDVATQEDIENGKKPQFIPEAKLEGGPKRPEPVFEYNHVDADHPSVVEFRSGVPYFDGQPTSHAHINALMGNVEAGLATIKYKNSDKMQKSESLAKADVSEAFGALRKLVEAGHLSPEHERILGEHVFKDPMTGLGNKFAHSDMLTRPREGVHVVADINDFKNINDNFGHPVGDAAITATGQAVRNAMDEVAPGEGKAYRIGGDEFSFHLPNHETAARFARSLRKHMDKIEPVGGSHRLSMSLGFGSDHETADKALYEAKKQKHTPETQHLAPGLQQRAFIKGKVPHLAHSLVPGHEGPVPLDDSANRVVAPEKPPEPVAKPGSVPA